MQDLTRPQTALSAPPPSDPAPVVAPFPLSNPFRDRRVALVIGNLQYRNAAYLANTGNDARLVADVLRRLGFELVGNGPLLDLDRSAFEKAVATFGQRLDGSNVALFYYAGHGIQIQGLNYLVPIDANPSKASDADFQLIDANAVLRQMEDSGAKLKVVILDACRNNPFGGRGFVRDSGSGLAQMRVPQGTVISYATQPGNVASDGDPGRDSPYALALAEAMQRPKLDVLRMFNEVGVKVDRDTNHRQQPWLSSSPISGEYFLAGQ